jgi:hypothetical protein
VTTIGDVDVITKMLMLLATSSYGSIMTYFFQQDLTMLNIDHAMGKLNAYEGYNLGHTLSLLHPASWLFKQRKSPRTRRKGPWLNKRRRVVNKMR